MSLSNTENKQNKDNSNFKQILTEKLENIFDASKRHDYNFTLNEPSKKNNNNSDSNSYNNSNANSSNNKSGYNSSSSNYTNTSNNGKTQNENSFESKNIFDNLDVSLEYIKEKYNTSINSDIIIREFTLTARNRQYKAMLFFIDGMVDSELINNNVLEALMMRNRANMFNRDQDQVISEAKTNNITVRKVKKFNLEDYIFDSLLPQNNVKKVSTFSKAFEGVNVGNCLLFVDTLSVAFDIDVKGFKQREVSTPNNEIIIKGPQEAFVENIRTNTSLLRRLVNSEHLIIENVEVGKISKTKCAICYIDNIANSDLVSEVKYRINNLDIDSLLSSGELEQLIEENNKYSIPQMLSTERPDKTTKYLYSGRVAVLISGNPYCLIMPATLIDFIASPEDTNLKFQFSNFLKFLRLLAIFITLFLPALYVAVTDSHQELLPTELLFALMASRENVPFPVIFEILIMEISFELIREAGIRVPSPLGSTIGIVGALVIRTSCG